jgi:DNA-binding NarL/FixJ family response regulator
VRRWRLLLAEDDELHGRLLSTLLGEDGRFEIVGVAADGRKAVELASSLSPDVVLIDIQMPHMDGIAATRHIREQNPSLPVVVLSSSEYEDRALEARDAGAADYVRKGRIDEDLAEAIVAAIG